MLLDPEARARVRLRTARAHRRRRRWRSSRSCSPSRSAENKLREEDEQRLYERGRGARPGARRHASGDRCGTRAARRRARGGDAVVRASAPRRCAAPLPRQVVPAEAAEIRLDEFRRMLRLSKLCLDGDEMTDDQRDAMCNLGESLGLTGGQAEDLIDEYLEEAQRACRRRRSRALRCAPAARRPRRAQAGDSAPPPREKAPSPRRRRRSREGESINISPLARAQERLKYPEFHQRHRHGDAARHLRRVSSWAATARDAAPNEQPVTHGDR